VQIDIFLGLGVALVLGTAAYLGCKNEKAMGKQTPEVDPIIVGIIAIVLTAVSFYLFAQVPVLLWEIATGMISGSFALRLFFHKI
jgi:hypothetical protein